MEKNTKIRIIRRTLRMAFAPIDVMLSFAIILLSFIGNRDWNSLNPTVLNPILIYSASVALAIGLMLFLTRTYKLIMSEFGIFEALTMFGVVLCTQIVALVPEALIKELPPIKEYFWSWGLATVALGFTLVGMRLLVRVTNIFVKQAHKKSSVRTLVIGAGSAGKIVLDESRRNVDNHNKVVVFMDDNPEKIDRVLGGVPVKGPITKIGSMIEYYDVEEVIIAISNLSEARLREILSLVRDANVRIRRMPLLNEMEGPNDKRIIDVDLNELLCRPMVKLDNSEVFNMLKGNTVLVTGAGGSIGSELVRQIFKTHPSTLVLFDIYENSTYDIQQELRILMREQNITDINLVTLIGSTYNEKRMEQVFKKYKPDYIYHAAAYKHVPLMEDSPAEAIRTNVIGTYNVARLADKYKVKKMVLVSTDKAVRPTNTMGATKRFAETIIQYFSNKSKNTAYAAVRFGNVLGSNGSVVPLFKKQIEKGGPITLTSKDIIRYFMTIPEAVSLILQCGLFAEGGEIFILDMGEPVKIYNLACLLIRQAGLTPNKDIEIREVGLRPGEKLYEELLIDRSKQRKTPNEKIFIEPSEAVQPIEEEMKTISNVFDMDHNLDVKKMLASIITTYSVDDRGED